MKMVAGLKSTLRWTQCQAPESRKFTPLIAHITTAVILLSFVLAVGFLMIILSCTLYSNWLPLLVGMSFSFARGQPHSRVVSIRLLTY